MKYLLSLIFVAYNLFVANCSGQEDEIAARCNLAANTMKRIEAIAAFKLHAKVTVRSSANSTVNSDNEVWLEGRGNKVWAQVLQQPIEGTEQAEKHQQLSVLLNSDLRETFVFDGRRMIVHQPIKLKVKAEVDEGFQTPFELRPVFPSSWTDFLVKPTSPGSKLAFSYFLTDNFSDCETRLDTSQNLLAVSLVSASQTAMPVSFALRKVEIDQETNLIRHSEASGGRASPVMGWYEWTATEGLHFVSKGKVVYGNNQTIEWSIDEFTSDPRKVRTKFDLDEANLPLGTRIDEEPYNKQKRREIRFVGGAGGEREYGLKYESVRLLSERLGDNR